MMSVWLMLKCRSKWLFLGNFIDHGGHSLWVITLLLALKLKYPNRIFLIRGKHECAAINRIYGFYDECKIDRLPSFLG